MSKKIVLSKKSLENSLCFGSTLFFPLLSADRAEYTVLGAPVSNSVSYTSLYFVLDSVEFPTTVSRKCPTDRSCVGLYQDRKEN